MMALRPSRNATIPFGLVIPVRFSWCGAQHEKRNIS